MASLLLILHLFLQEKLFSSKNRTEVSVGKKLKNNMLPEIEMVHKVIYYSSLKDNLHYISLSFALNSPFNRHPFLWDVNKIQVVFLFGCWAKKCFSTEKGEVVKETT